MLRNTLFLPIVAAAFLLSPMLKAGTYEDYQKASVLLQRVEAHAIDARHHAARLNSYRRFPDQYSWQLHADELRQIKEDVGEIGDLLDQFEDIKNSASDRQTKAFNAAVIQAAKLADATDASIEMVNENKRRVGAAFPDYDDKLTNLYNSSDYVVAAIGFAESWTEVMDAREKFNAMSQAATNEPMSQTQGN